MDNSIANNALGTTHCTNVLIFHYSRIYVTAKIRLVCLEFSEVCSPYTDAGFIVSFIPFFANDDVGICS